MKGDRGRTLRKQEGRIFFTLPLEPSFHEWTRARAYLVRTKKGVPDYLPLPYREWTELEAYASFTDSRYRTIRKPSKRLKKKDWMICGMRNCLNCLTKVLPFLSLLLGHWQPQMGFHTRLCCCYWVGWRHLSYYIIWKNIVRWLAARTKQGELYGGFQAEDWMNWDAYRIDGRVPNLA